MEIDVRLHQKLAVTLNGEVWSLLGKEERSDDDIWPRAPCCTRRTEPARL